MKFENTEVWGFEGALRGMRNPKNSWDRSDSDFVLDENGLNEGFIIGPNDLDLATRLIKAGPEHRKFLRMMHVQADITGPLYWWKEYDTYKVSTVANSTSTMHKITSKPITLDCFEIDDYDKDFEIEKSEGNRTEDEFTFKFGYTVGDMAENIIEDLENLRQKYLETKDVRYWKELIRWLPEGWLQTRTVDLNYETLRAMYFQRKNHRLSEWHQFCSWVETLPYSSELITLGTDVCPA